MNKYIVGLVVVGLISAILIVLVHLERHIKAKGVTLADRIEVIRIIDRLP